MPKVAEIQPNSRQKNCKTMLIGARLATKYAVRLKPAASTEWRAVCMSSFIRHILGHHALRTPDGCLLLVISGWCRRSKKLFAHHFCDWLHRRNSNCVLRMGGKSTRDAHTLGCCCDFRMGGNRFMARPRASLARAPPPWPWWALTAPLLELLHAGPMDQADTI